jgi:hypothetical protein
VPPVLGVAVWLRTHCLSTPTPLGSHCSAHLSTPRSIFFFSCCISKNNVFSRYFFAGIPVMLNDLSMDDSLRVHLGFEDYILFQPVESTVAGRSLLIFDNFAVGKIIGGTANVLQVQVFTRMTSEVCLQYSLPPVTTAAYPTASFANMIEVVDCQDSYVNVARSAIHDIAHIMPLPEVESGLFHSLPQKVSQYKCTMGKV